MKKLHFIILQLFISNLVFGQVADWVSLGPFERPTNYLKGYGRVSSVRFDPGYTTNGIFYVGAPHGGLWKWDPTVGYWQILNTDILPHVGVSDEAIDYNDNQHIYVATGDADLGFDPYAPGLGSTADQSRGIFESTDGGATWTSSTPIGTWYDGGAVAILNFWDFPSRKCIKRLLINPNNSNELICLVNTYSTSLMKEESWIYKTIDGGSNWYIKLHLTDQRLWDLEFKPGDPTVVYASGYSVFKSTNSGNTWTDLAPATPYGRIDIAVTPDDPNAIYFLQYDAPGNEAIYVSYNSGTSFTLVATIAGSIHVERMGLAIDPLDKYNMFCSDASNKTQRIYSLNSGSTWSSSGSFSSTHDDIHDLTFRPDQSSVLVSSDGGLFETSDNGATWNFIGDGMVVSQLWSIATAQTDPDVYLIGLQDNGTVLHNPYIFPSNGNWGTIYGGDGMECEIAIDNEQVLYQSDNQTSHDNIHRSDNSGASWTMVYPAGQTNGNFRPIATHPANPDLFYVVYHDVLKSSDRGNNYTQSSTIPNSDPGDRLMALSISPTDENVIYVSYHLPSTSHLDRVFKTSDGGVTWEDLGDGTVSCPNNMIAIEDAGIVQGISVDANNPDIVYIGTWGGGTYKVMKGEPYNCIPYVFYNWTDYSTGLPDCDIFWLTSEVGSTNIYAGTTMGVYYRNNQLNQWMPFKDNLPNSQIMQLKINYTSNQIFAATHGRGAWKSHLACPTQNSLVLNGNAVDQEFDEAEQITSTASVATGIKVRYRATDEIVLSPDFIAHSGSDFDAFIHGCDQSGNSFRRAGNPNADNHNSTTHHEINQNYNSEEDNSFTIFPNPSQGKCIIKFRNENLKSIAVTDAFGKVVWQSSINYSDEINLNLTQNIPGVYYVKVDEGESYSVKRLIVL